LVRGGHAMTMGPLFFALFVTASPSPPPNADIPFDEALALAKASVNVPGREAYRKALAAKASKHLESALNDCLAGPVSRQTLVQVLLKLEPDGKVSSAMVRPEGRVTICVRDKLRRRTFPKPAEGTWKLIEVRLNP
jgi:hypothetical protein